MSLLNTLRIGQSGLSAASSAIEVVGHNVTNATTEGYHARSVSTSASSPVSKSGNWFGQGTSISEIGRESDELLSSRLLEAEGDAAHQSALYESLSVVEAMFSETDEAGLATKLSEFFDSLEAASVDPSDSSLRGSVLAAAESLAGSVQSTNSFLESTADGVVSQIEDSVGEINEALQQIQALQESIESDANTSGQGDLLDARDALVSDLASSIGATVEYGENNEITIFVGGHAVFNDTAARTLSYSTDSDGNPELRLSTGESDYAITDAMGGAIGGLLESLDVVAGLQEDLADFASTFTDAFNAQHASGYDSDGNAGGDFFTYTSGSEASTFAVDASLAADLGLMALAGSSTASAGDGDNLGELIDLQDEALFDSGTETAEEFISSIYTTIGQEVATALAASESAAATSSDLSTLYDNITGVNLDDQAVELIEWQAAYQAAARVISASDELLAELMELAR